MLLYDRKYNDTSRAICAGYMNIVLSGRTTRYFPWHMERKIYFERHLDLDLTSGADNYVGITSSVINMHARCK